MTHRSIITDTLFGRPVSVTDTIYGLSTFTSKLKLSTSEIRGVRDLNTGLELPKLKAYQASLTPRSEII